MAAVKKILGDLSVHVEARRGSRDQARDYCFKEDPAPFEFGSFEAGGQGSRYVIGFGWRYL